jgi:hypothetical protein
VVPADGPDRIGRGVLVAFDSARTSDFRELIPADDGPLVGPAVPFGQHTAGDVRILLRFGAMLAVVRVHDAALTGVETFPVIARKVGVAAGLDLLIGPELFDGERLDVDFVKALFHRRVI